jgi:hypothetical protein
MSDEFVYEDGRKAEKIEIDQGKTKVTEIYVEPKTEKKLAQRITEKYCVCEREIETIDENTGEIVSKVIEKVLGDAVTTQDAELKPSMESIVEEKINKKSKPSSFGVLIGVGLTVLIVAQLVGMAYLLFVK